MVHVCKVRVFTSGKENWYVPILSLTGDVRASYHACTGLSVTLTYADLTDNLPEADIPGLQ